jgi:hypothetical protein
VKADFGGHTGHAHPVNFLVSFLRCLAVSAVSYEVSSLHLSKSSITG